MAKAKKTPFITHNVRLTLKSSRTTGPLMVQIPKDNVRQCLWAPFLYTPRGKKGDSLNVVQREGHRYKEKKSGENAQPSEWFGKNIEEKKWWHPCTLSRGKGGLWAGGV